MQSRRQAFLSLCAVLIFFVGLNAAFASNSIEQVPPDTFIEYLEGKTYDLCARVEGKSEADPVLQTLRVKLQLKGGPRSHDMLKMLQAELIAKSVEKMLGPVEIFVEEYDRKTCAAAGENFLELSVPSNVSKSLQSLMSGTGTAMDARSIASVLKGSPAITPQVISSKNNDHTNSASLRIFFATNRNATGVPNTRGAFGKKIGALSYGEVQVQVTRQPHMNKLESASIAKFERVTDLKNFAVANKYSMLSHDEWVKEVKARASDFNKPGVLLFVHGYNNSFVDAAAIAGQFTYDMAFSGASVMFSWPSQNKMIRYFDDSALAESSATAMAAVLNDLTALQKDGPVYVVAHSMGNLVLLNGMKQFLSTSTEEQKRSITEVVLAAPDVPRDAFKANWGDVLINNSIYPTLYASKNDLVINSSKSLNFCKGPRLGQGGEKLFQMNNLVSIDASRVTTNFFALHHAYFRDNNTVASDLFGLLRERKKVEKRPNLKKRSDVYSSWELQARN